MHVGINVAYTAYCAEWMPVRGILKVDSLELRIVPGTVFEISGNDPAMVFRKDVGSPVEPAITVVAAQDGRLHFDYEFTGPALEKAGPQGTPLAIRVTNLKTTKSKNVFVWPSYGWRGPKMPVTLCDETGAPLGDTPSSNLVGRGLSVCFARPAEWEKARYFFLEHRRKTAGSEWRGPAVLNPAFGEILIASVRSGWSRRRFPRITNGRFPRRSRRRREQLLQPEGLKAIRPRVERVNE